MSLWARDGGHRVLLANAAVHLTNDACFAILYPLLPLIAATLHLSYAQVGLLQATFSGASSVLQIPVGLLGERIGEPLVLVLGNAWVGLGLGTMALAGGFVMLLGTTLLAGLGGNAQHPLGTALVSGAFGPGRMAMALGTFNFAGDVGKLVGLLVAGIVAARVGWRPALAIMGTLTAVFSLALLVRQPASVLSAGLSARPQEGHASVERTGMRWGFSLLLVAGSLDTATRSAALTFLPFLLTRHGVSPALVSVLLGLMFAGGAAGKFLCGWLSARWGTVVVIIVSEVTTAVTLAGFLVTPAWLTAPLALVCGFALNGTSSAFTTAVAHVVPAHRRTRGYGIYFTAALVSSALAPLAYGVLGDRAGLQAVFLVIAALTAATFLPVLPMRTALTARPTAEAP